MYKIGHDGSLVLKTRELLNESKESYHTISMKTNLPSTWLKQFAQRNSDNPTCNRVQALYEYLTGKPLKV